MKRISTLLIVGLLFCTLAVHAQSAKRKSVKTSYLNYPVVPLESVDSYRIAIYPNSIAVDQNDIRIKSGLGKTFSGNISADIGPSYFTYKDIKFEQNDADVNVEIAFGDFEIIGKEIKSHEIPCKQKGAKLTKDNILECPAYYYEINYNLPTIVRVRDNSGKTLYVSKMEDTGKTHFGYDKTGLSGYILAPEMEAAYTKPGVRENIEKKVLVDRLIGLEHHVNQGFYFYKTAVKIDVATASGKAFDYSSLDNAQQKALAAYEKMGDGEDISSELSEVIAVWEAAIQTLDKKDTKARINRRVGLGLYENLAQAYSYAHDNERAIENINKALKLQQMVGNKSREPYLNELRTLFIDRKNTENGYLINKNFISGNRMEAPMILHNARVKEKDNPYQFLYGGNKIEEFRADYTAYAGEEKKEESEEITLEGAIEQFKNASYADRIQVTSAGNMLVLMSLTGDKFETLPLEICELADLNQLNAGGIPGFSTIPSDIKKMQGLKKLMIQNNQIKELPAEIGSLPNLEVLNLANNQLTSLPSEIKNLKKLKKLNIKGNNISPDQISEIQAALPKCKIK